MRYEHTKDQHTEMSWSMLQREADTWECRESVELLRQPEIFP